MIAAGNIQEERELYLIKNLVQKTLDHYLMNVGKTRDQAINTRDQQNYYAKNQKMNLHTPRFLVSLGLSEEKGVQCVYISCFSNGELFIQYGQVPLYFPEHRVNSISLPTILTFVRTSGPLPMSVAPFNGL